jgi:hypothetical protein
MASHPLSEPPPSGPASGVLVRLLPFADASMEAAPMSTRSGRRATEPPPSGPVSGVVAPVLFRGEGGPGFWIRGPETSVEARLVDIDAGPCKIIRLAPNGAWFVPEPGVDYPLDTPVQITLHAGETEIGPIWVKVVAPPSLAQDNPIFGLAFQDIQFRMAREIVVLLRDLAAAGAAQLAHRSAQVREEITETSRIRSVIRALAGVNSRGTVDGLPNAVLRMTSFDEPGGILLWEGSGEWGSAPFVVDVTGYNSVYRLHFDVVSPAGPACAMTSLPRRIERLRHRQYRRGDVNGTLGVSLHHPLWPRLPQIKREVRDISFGGISFDTILDDLLFPGLTLPLIEVTDQDGEVVRLKGEVRSVGHQGDEAVARVSVSHYSWRDESRWNRLVARMLYPTTRSDETWGDPTWSLMKDAGYFNLSGKAPEHFVQLKTSYLQVDKQGASVPGLFCHAVFPADDGSVHGTVSIMKVYKSSWMLHQLAKRRGSCNVQNPRAILRDLYTRAFEHTQTDQGFRYIFAYAEADVPWNKLSHFAFAEKYVGSGKALAMPFRLMEVSVADRSPRVPDPAEIGLAVSREIGLVLGHVRRTRPACYVEALDLTPEHADLSGISRRWSQAGFMRDRAVFVARRGGVVVAAAIVECGETGANLFRLVDSMRLVALVTGGDGTFSSLVDAARDWFRERGKDAFVYFRENEDPGPAEVMKLRDLGPGVFWVIASELMPDFLEHVFESTSPRRMTAQQAEDAAPGVRR